MSGVDEVVKTYFSETSIFNKNYILNNIRMKKLRDKYLVTVDSGGWVVLDKEEYRSVLRYELSDELFHILEEKGIIITENNMQVIINDTKRRLGFLFNGVSLHIIVPTLRCNQKCIYCHSSAKKCDDKRYDMDKNTAKKILEFIFQTPAKTITIEFQGGEPTLNFETFKYIVTEAKKMNEDFKKIVHFELVSNLTLMNEEMVDFIKKEGVDMCASLDGNKEVHDYNRPFEDGNGTYDNVTCSRNLLKNKHKIRVPSLMVTTRKSLSMHKEIIDEYVKNEESDFQIKSINKLGFAEATWKKVGYSKEDFIEFWKRCADYLIEKNKKGSKIRSRYINLILIKILSKRDPSFLDFRSPCGIGIGQLAYNYNGDIYCCDEGRNFDMFRLGNVKDHSYPEVISSEKTMQLVSSSLNDNFLCDNCVYKPFCGICPVISYAEQGNMIAKLGSFSKCHLQKEEFDYVFDKLIFDREVRKIFFDWFNNWRS